MLTALLIFMASRVTGTPPGGNRSAGARSRNTPRKPRGTASRPPQPNHFLSVRIDNAQIWENVSNLQNDILASSEHLKGAAIPVQDLHLTLFVLTLHEEDGSLQRARETLKVCRDVLVEDGLSPQDERRSPPAHTLCEDDTAPSEEARPLTLSFRGLGNFRNKVLFVRLVEDEQAARFRRWVSALHRRFSEASLLTATPPPSSPRKGSHAEDGSSTAGSSGGGGDGGGTGSDEYEFTPHLTVMKTSKLRDRRTEIPPASYDRHDQESFFGEHAPSAVELSSMLEREDMPSLSASWEPRPYYKCEQRLALLARHPERDVENFA